MGFWDLFTGAVAAVDGHDGHHRNDVSSSHSSQGSSDGVSGICTSSSGSNGGQGASMPAGLSESDFVRLQEMFKQGYGLVWQMPPPLLEPEIVKHHVIRCKAVK